MLTNFVSVYVPSTQDGAPLTEAHHASWTRYVARAFSEKFGGATVTPSTGYWVSDIDGLVEERINIVTSYFEAGQAEEALAAAHRIAETLKHALGQEAVTVQTPEGIEFI